MDIKLNYRQEYCPIEFEKLEKCFSIWESHYRTDYNSFVEDIRTMNFTLPNRVNYIKYTIDKLKELIQENRHRVRMLYWAYNHGYHKNKDMINGKEVYEEFMNIVNYYNKIKDFNPDLEIKQIKMKEKLKRLKEDF